MEIGLSDIIAVLAIFVAIASVIVAIVANIRAKEALALQSRIDEREREFRAVEWDTSVPLKVDGVATEFILTNVGDSDARSVTAVLHLNPDREVHHVGDIPAKHSVTITSPQFTDWMREAVEHEVVNPSARVHWSSPLGQVGDETLPMKTIHDFIDWRDDPTF
jgi:hypothetical protein